MISRIQILPENLANQIAAGEVVERPASVVKELVENSIDALASEIFVDIEKGGKALVRVTDNGHGMKKDDAFLSLERHATSKIKCAEDLFALNTMGFRGEALPAIASVSRLRLTTRSVDDDAGWQIYAEGGTIRQADAVGAAPGTVVEVRNLFFNTPGRRKFLRKEETEFGHIADVVSRLALSRPDIHFRLSHNGRNYLEAYRHNRLEERVAALLGRNLAGGLLPVDADSGDGEMLVGLLGSPGISRSTTGQVFTYVNGRFVRDRVIQHAIIEAYRSLLEKRRYPIAVLFIDMPPERVDVNVHPTKHEVRFRNQQQVHDFIVTALRARLQQVANQAVPGSAGFHPLQIEPLASPLPPAQTDYRSRVQESLAAFNEKVAAAPIMPAVSTVKGEMTGWSAGQDNATAMPDGWRLIGQYLNSYLICQVHDELVLLDQHAAHERIGFERLRRQLASDGIESQSLLFPVVLELDHRESAVLTEHLDDFARFGFEVDAFGGRSFTVKSVPALVAHVDVERLIRDLAAELNEIGRSGQLDDEIERVLAVLACHSMVRANQALSQSEMQHLLKDLSAIDFGSCCPHGRPVTHRLSRRDVEKFFHRG
ncbi:MAG: DNA mismatch repair endonuclease MutL [Desulfuromonadales bacterium]